MWTYREVGDPAIGYGPDNHSGEPTCTCLLTPADAIRDRGPVDDRVRARRPQSGTRIEALRPDGTGMDLTNQLHLADATGWRRGLYEDVICTFRAPIVNSIWRTLVANRPDAARHLWAAVKPTFETRAFADFSVRYRDRVLDALEPDGDDEPTLPSYDPGDVDLSASAFATLRGQLATFDVVAPRLAALFAVCDRALSGAFGDPREDHAATASAPDWLDADRGARVTVIDSDAAREAAPDTVADIDAYHGTAFLPSIYRCAAQWPAYLERAWTDLEPFRARDADDSGGSFAAAEIAADETVDEFLGRPPVPFTVTTEGLAAAGVDDPEAALSDLQGTFAAFASGVSGVLPVLHALAATVDATGERGWRLAE